MKKFLTLILLSMIAFNAIYADVTWNLSDDGTLTISGTDMPDYSYPDYAPWYSQRVKIKNVLIKKGVTNIGANAFYICINLTAVNIPNSVKNIGNNAFSSCSRLVSISIPNSITSIGDGTFSRCSSLPFINIPESVTSIGREAFWGCSSLNSISIPNSVTSIGTSLFGGCSNLEYVLVEKGNPNYDSRNNCNAIIETRTNSLIAGCKNTVIPNSVMSIGKTAFSNCEALTSIAIPNSVTNIEDCAFSSCPSLASMNIPNSVTRIGSQAFYYCKSLTSINIPESVICIGSGAFHETKWHDDQPDGLIYIGSFLYGYKGSMPTNAEIDIKEGTKRFADNAFNGYSSLHSVSIPESVISLGEHAFHNCLGLTNIIIPNSVTSIGAYTFYGCQSLTSVIIPNSVTNIDDYAFYNCQSLTPVIIPSSVKRIGACTFLNCQSLTSIIIPNSVKDIEKSAFEGCSHLTTISFPNSAINIGYRAFSGTKWYDMQSNGLIYVGSCLYQYKGAMPSNTDVIIKNGTEGIAGGAFSGCSNLISITIPESVKCIGDNAFSGCSGLTSITIPNSVMSIGKGSFKGCSGLKSITIPNSVTSIEKEAFRNCSSLTSITLPESINSISYAVFSDCSSLTSITIPNSVTSIGREAFSGCSSLTSVKIPNSVEIIDMGAFALCSSLISINIPNNVNKIGDETFYACKVLSEFTCNAPAPPSIGKYVFYDTQCEVGTLYVPSSAISAYQIAGGWKDWKNIQAIIEPTSVSFTNTSDKLIIGMTKILKVFISPENAMDKSIIWNSSNEDVAIVSSEGVVTAKNVGTAIITVKTCNGKTATCKITVEQPITSIILNDATPLLWIGETKVLKTTIAPSTASNTTVEWSSSDNNIATVSSEGMITAKGKGSCIITCTANDGYGAKATCEVTVKQQVASIAISDAKTSLCVGETKSLTAIATPRTANNTAVNWSSSDENVATVSSDGIVTAKGQGICTITCTAADGYGTKSTCEITIKQQVTEIALSETNASLWVGDTKTITATALPTTANNTSVEWSSSDDNVATVSSEGVITAKGKGSCIISCTAADGYGTMSTCEVTVKQQVTEIVLSETNASLWVGDTKTLTATASPTTASNTAIEWSSSDDNVASVSSEGVITANGEGTCIITCTAADGYGTKSTCEVTVKQQVTEIVLSETTVSLCLGDTKTITATATLTTVGNTDVIWSSSDDNVATVSSNGVITAKGEGTCIITCTVADGYGAVSICEVTVMQQATSLDDLRFANDKSPVYNLNGQRIIKAHAQKGIYIKNGKKYANKY